MVGHEEREHLEEGHNFPWYDARLGTLVPEPATKIILQPWQRGVLGCRASPLFWAVKL